MDTTNLPQHIAIIMDGNGRWAKQHGRERLYGHRNGTASVRAVLEKCVELGIPYLTLYAFSLENWNRPKDEVDGLMDLFVENLVKELPEFHERGIRLLTIGDRSLLTPRTLVLIENFERETAHYTRTTLVLALSYSARWEITEMARRIARDVAAGRLRPEQITDETVAANMQTAHIPDPDLLIRTSGEFRLSNFLLWQLAYTELYFTDTLWPDFGKEQLVEAIEQYQNRERRFGKTSEQLNQSNNTAE